MVVPNQCQGKEACPLVTSAAASAICVQFVTAIYCAQAENVSVHSQPDMPQRRRTVRILMHEALTIRAGSDRSEALSDITYTPPHSIAMTDADDVLLSALIIPPLTRYLRDGMTFLKPLSISRIP